MRQTFLRLVLVLLFVPVAYGAKYAGQFLEIGVGARAVGMGGAFAAVADDPLSFYWNPSGTGYVSGPHVSAMYADLWNGLANYTVGGVAMPVSGAVFSVNYVRLGVPDIQEHPDYALSRNRVLRGDTLSVQEYLLATGASPRGVFGAGESAVFVTFAKLNRITLDMGWSYFQFPIEIPVGASMKMINQKLRGGSGSGIGADFGAQVRLRMSDIFHAKWKGMLSWGFNWQDATRTAIDWGEGNKDAIPPNFHSGVAYTQKLPGKESRVTIAYERERRWEVTHHVGLEYTYGGVLALRGGFWGDQWTAGAGLTLWRAAVDYAYLSRELGSTHRVSLTLRLR